MTTPKLLEPAELYRRDSATLLASWAAYARGSAGATTSTW